MSDNMWARRSWLSTIGAAAAALTFGAKGAPAQAPPPAGRFQATRHPQDAWLDSLPGQHRTFIDSFTIRGGGEAILFANNLFTANKAGYNLNDSDVAVVVCLRHLSTIFAFNDAIWAKYGKAMSESSSFTDPNTHQAPSSNLYNTAGYGAALATLGNTIDAVAKRGTHFAVCDMATRRVSGGVARAVGGTPDALYKEFVSSLVPNSHMVAAGVVAVNRAQEYGYTLLSAG
jgi:hypothetical protein